MKAHSSFYLDLAQSINQASYDYGTELMTGMRTIYDIVEENNEKYRQTMKDQYE